MEEKVTLFERFVNALKKIKICYITTLLYVFFIGWKLVKTEFIVPQDYILIGLLTLLVIVSYIYDVVRYALKLKHTKNTDTDKEK